MKNYYSKKDIQNGLTNEIPLKSKVVIDVGVAKFKGKVVFNEDDIIGIDYPKNLGGTYIVKNGIEFITMIG